MKYLFGFIGCGNMGGALISAVTKAAPRGAVAVYDTDKSKADYTVREYSAVAADIKTVVSESKFVVLGVKPQVIFDCIGGIKEYLSPESIVISMAAGVSVSAIKDAVGSLGVIRIMPNLPAALGEGIILYATSGVSEGDEADFVRYFTPCGYVDKIEESKIDAASAITGCGPAFVYIFAEALADAAVECGIPRDKAVEYVAGTLCGAGRMIQKYKTPATLKDAVCSAGGTTIAGVHALERAGLRAAAMDAVVAAYEKTLKLSKNK